MSQLDHFKACLYGAAIGDALGAPYEFNHAPVKVKEQYGRGVFGTAPGSPTDDSTLVGLHADAWIEVANGDPPNKLWDAFEKVYSAKLVAWKDSRPPDIGGQTSSSIELLRQGRKPVETSRSGNGSLMGVAPLGLVGCRLTDAELGQLADRFSDLTHCNAASRYACRQQVCAIAALVNGEPKSDVIDRYSIPVPAGMDIDGHAMGFSLIAGGLAFRALNQFGPRRGRKGRYSSWWATMRTLVELGGDTDTNAAIAGALVGAAATPGHQSGWMLDTLIGRDEWENRASKLWALYAARPAGE